MAQLNFDARTVQPDAPMEAIPAGWYNMQINGSEMKPTSDGKGAYLQVTLKVLDGQHAGRQVFDRLNLQNANPVAVDIAYKRLSAYCHATGVINLQDSQQLHGIPMKVKVNVRTDSTGQYEPSNDVKAVKNINEQVDMGAGAPQVGVQQPMVQQAAVQQPQPQYQQPAYQQPAPQQQFQQPAPQQFQQPMQPAPVQQQQYQQPEQQAPAWAQQQQAPVQQQVQQPAPQQAPAQTPPWVQAQQPQQ